MANYASLKLPVNKLNKVFFSHLHADQMGDVLTLAGGAVVQAQDFTVFNITQEAVVARQAKVLPQLPPIPGVQRVPFEPVAVPPPAWWAEALIPRD
jgi:hypothetical protein